MPASIKDVAERAGVSTATVSHVLNNTRKIRPSTRAEVMKAVEELGYSINRAARNLAMGRSSLLGMVVADIRNPFFPEVTVAFQDQALLHQMEALVLNTNNDPARLEDCLKRLIGLQVAGIAILTSQVDPPVFDILANRNLPAVFLDQGRVGNLMSNIAIEYERGIATGLEHLKSLGHHDVAYIGGPVHLYTAQRRKAAFVDNAGRLKMRTVAAMDGDFTVNGGYHATARLLKNYKPTALMCVNDLTAIGALHCAYDLGIRVPHDLSVVGFNDIDISQNTQPPLTTIAISRERIGSLAYEALSELIGGPSKEGREYSIETKLVVRQSSAAPPGSKGD